MRRFKEQVRAAIQGLVRHQGGAQTFEWIALGILVLALMAGAAKVIGDNNELGQKVIQAVGRLMDNIGK